MGRRCSRGRGAAFNAGVRAAEPLDDSDCRLGVSGAWVAISDRVRDVFGVCWASGAARDSVILSFDF